MGQHKLALDPPTPAETRAFYESIAELYPSDDRWHRITHDWISRFVRNELGDDVTLRDQSVLNLGSGGQSFGLPERAICHVDLHGNGFTRDQRLILGDVQALPEFCHLFDFCICVGSVINHCDAAVVISEICRVLKPGGRLILEFESSHSFEFLLSTPFRKSAAIVTTLYQGREIRLWIYSPQYIRSLLRTFEFAVSKRAMKHILSSAVFRIWPRPNFAARFHCLDGMARLLPTLREHAHNVIFLCQKSY